MTSNIHICHSISTIRIQSQLPIPINLPIPFMTNNHYMIPSILGNTKIRLEYLIIIIYIIIKTQISRRVYRQLPPIIIMVPLLIKYVGSRSRININIKPHTNTNLTSQTSQGLTTLCINSKPFISISCRKIHCPSSIMTSCCIISWLSSRRQRNSMR